MFKSRNESLIVYKCTVRLLEDSDVLECEFQPNHKGNFLLEYVCEQLEIKEKDYFGLRYVDSTKQRHWLDLAKSIIKQVKDVDPILFSFRVKFYPADPFRLSGNGRFMLYQQLKRDLRHGRLYCSTGEAAALGALIVQEEIGDYDPEIHTGDYVSSLRLALRQTDVLEKKIMDLHQKREPGQDPQIAIDEFMSIARGLETYGVDPHPVKDHRGTQLYLGINNSGISTFVSGKRAQHFRWPEVSKLNYEGKMFIAHLSYTDASREPKKHTIGFKCPTGTACRYVWRCAIEQMLFFTLPNSQNASVVTGGGFFSFGTKFRYSGRTEREILTESINALREQQMATLSSSPKKRKASSVPATPSSPQGDLAQIRKLSRKSYISGYQLYNYYNYHSGYSSLPRSTMSEPLGNCGGGTAIGAGVNANDHRLSNIIYNPDGTISSSQMQHQQTATLLEPVSEEANRRTSSSAVAAAAASVNYDNNTTAIINTSHPSELSDYYFRDSFEHSSTESGLTSTYIDAQRLHYGSGVGGGVGGSRQLLYPVGDNPVVVGGGGYIPFHSTSTLPSNTILNNNNSSSSMIRQQNLANSAKNVRKFRLLHAFIPSFLFVVIAMTISAVFILESESDMFARIRNLPEMISLRYQYYQPLKDYLARRLGTK